MPYIKPEERKHLTPTSVIYPSTSGGLNYQITCLLEQYLYKHGEVYSTYNDMIGALECAKLELYRRKVASYEDIKIQQNGDVW